MLSDDVYRTQLAKTYEQLVAAASAYLNAAEVVHVASPAFARLSLLPFARGACPVEMMLRADQFYDIQIGAEFYEDCRVENFDVFVPILEAIAQGNVVQRHLISAATGTEHGVETIVTLADGAVWQKGHTLAPHLANAATVCESRRFLPYRR